MNEAPAASQMWLKDDDYAHKIKYMAERTPIRQREDKLILSLGKIIGVSVISFRQGVFVLRITTDSRVYKAATTLDMNNLLEDSSLYDAWSLRWSPHAYRLISLGVIKDASDPDKLQACVNEQIRKLFFVETSATWSEQNMISPEPVNHPEPVQIPHKEQVSTSLFCSEKMVEEQEEEEEKTICWSFNSF